MLASYIVSNHSTLPLNQQSHNAPRRVNSNFPMTPLALELHLARRPLPGSHLGASTTEMINISEMTPWTVELNGVAKSEYFNTTSPADIHHLDYFMHC
ncbi:hypothetical protein BGX31_002603 [Mortierella sp. GBA43]|nr:hypothetical protein BGX31_002603 [Mortierella sp. GBA43]